MALDLAHALDDAARVTVGGVDHHHVHAGSHQALEPFMAVATGADGGPDAQLADAVLGGFGVGVGLQDVLDSHETAQLEGVVDDQHALKTVLVHELLGVIQAGALGHGDEPLARGHDVAHRLVKFGLEAQITVGDDADHLLAALDHGQTGDAVLAGDGDDLAHSHLGGDGDGVAHHAGLVAFDGQDLGCLPLGLEVLVDDADAAQLGHDDGHAAFGDGIHRRRDERDVEANFPGQARTQGCVAGNEV